jgi:WD40 repeat protein
MSEVITSVERRDCPYFGLDYYREEFGAWFFGREVEGDKIITNLQAARLTLLHAESGVGKSSLLRAGVAWRLRRLAHAEPPSSGAVVDLPVVFSSWKDDPVRELIGEISTAIEPFLGGRPAALLPSGRLDTAIEAAAEATDASLLVILDQFEEYFLYCSREPTPERFADELARCINRADVPANFLISIREDAYASLGDLFKGRIANVYGNYLHIDYLDRESAEQAIRAPLAVYNQQPGIPGPVTIQDDLVEAVLGQVRAYDTGSDPSGGRAPANGSGRRVSTPLLQLVMESVWQREMKQGSHELRLSTLQSMEGVEKIVDTHLGRALHALDKGERDTAIDVFDHLVTPSGGKIAESVPDLANRTGRDEDQVRSVLGKLDQARIVRSVPAPPGQDSTRFRRYEIFHDVLASAINHAIAVRDARRRARRMRRLAALVLGLAIVLGVGGLLINLIHNAVAERQLAQSRQLAATANTELASDPVLGAQVVLDALGQAPTAQAKEVLRGALRSALADIQEMRTFPDGTAAYGAAAFDPANANQVVSTGLDGSARIWNVETGSHINLVPPGGPGTTGAAKTVAFNPDGGEVAVGYDEGLVAVFDASSGYRAQVISVGPAVNDVQFVGSTGGLAIATAGGVGLWQPKELSHCCHTVLKGQADTVAVDPHNDRVFAVAGYSGTRIWVLGTNGRPVQPRGLLLPQNFLAHDTAAQFSANGKQLATAASDGEVRVYNTATAKLVATLNAGHGKAESVAFSPNGELIVAGYSSGATLVWNAFTDIQETQLTGNNGSVFSAQFSPDGREVVTASGDGEIRVWLAQPRELQTTFRTLVPSPIEAAGYSPGGGKILMDGVGFAELRTSTGSPVGYVFPPGGASVNSVRFDQSGTKIVSADSDGTVDLWRPVGTGYSELPQITLPSPIKLSGGPARYAAFSPDGSRILAVTDSATVEVFSARTGRRLVAFNPHGLSEFSAVVFSRDGRQVFTGDDNGQVEVWSSATGKRIGVLGAQGPGISDIEFDRSGSQFVTASSGGIVTIWSAHDDQPVDDQPVHYFTACPSPSTASFSPDARQIVVGCSDGTVAVFSATGQQLTVMSNPGIVNSAAFSPNGKTLVTAFTLGDSGYVRIWSSQLAASSLPALEQLAKRWVSPNLTSAEREAAYVVMNGSGGP